MQGKPFGSSPNRWSSWQPVTQIDGIGAGKVACEHHPADRLRQAPNNLTLRHKIMIAPVDQKLGHGQVFAVGEEGQAE